MSHRQPIRVEGLTPQGVSELQSLIKTESERNHYHRIEVEHALHLANLNAEITNDILVAGFQANLSKLDNIRYSIDELKDAVIQGFSEVQGFLYQLHVDNIGTQAILKDILSCMLDKAAFQRELQRRLEARVTAYRYTEARNEYTDALGLARRAFVESNRGKGSAMLDEAMHLFLRAAKEEHLALNAHFQLGYLYQTYKGDLELSCDYYNRSLGIPYSAHNVRTLRHIAHIHYCKGDFERSFALMRGLVGHMNRLEGFGRALEQVTTTDWPNCMDELEKAFTDYNDLLPRTAGLSSITQLFEKDRRFTATENFVQNFESIREELKRLRPNFQVLFDGSRYAAKCGETAVARMYLRDLLERLSTDAARRVAVLEAMANPDLKDA